MEITKCMRVWFEFHCLLVFISSSAGERELRLGPVQISSLSLAAIYGFFSGLPDALSIVNGHGVYHRVMVYRYLISTLLFKRSLFPSFFHTILYCMFT